MTTCPPEATLRLVGTDSVGEDTFARLEEHVEQCPHCQKILEGVTSAFPPAIPSAPPQDVPPTLPDLDIECRIGRGGTGVVYLAWEPVLKRRVAVKLFPTSALVDPHAREHWLSEARALSRVPHKNVAAIHRVGESKEWRWLVLEYVSGGTLKDRLTEPLPPRVAARLTETIARAVGCFHAQGVRHLDLKPSNILLDGEPGAPWESVSPKISDFGIARLDGEPGTTETGAYGPKGTPSYMAPEQVAALPGTIGCSADLHALGAILYHMLTGRPPFQGASTAETFDQVRNQEPVPPRRLNGRIPRDLETICLKCLEKVPNRRYESAEAMADDLCLWLADRPIKGRRVSPWGRAWRWCRRHPAVAGLLAMLAMTLTTGVIGLFVLLRQAKAMNVRLGELVRDMEVYEQFSADAVDQIALILRTSIHHQESATRGEMEASLSKLFNSTRDVINRGMLPSYTVVVLERDIGWALLSVGKHEEAWKLSNDAVADLRRKLAKDHDDSQTRAHLRNALFTNGLFAENTGQFQDALNSYEETFELEWDSEPVDHRCGVLVDIYTRLQCLADRFGQNGESVQRDRAQRVIHRVIRRFAGSEFADSTDVSGPGPELLGRILQLDEVKAMSRNSSTRPRYDEFVTRLLVRSVEFCSPFRSATAAAVYDRDPEAGNVALISAIQQQCSKFGGADSIISVTTDLMRADAVIETSRHRERGRFDDARLTAARLMAIARHLVREYPNIASSHRLLSEAFNQIRKNAFKTGDDHLIEEATVQAIAAARRALALDPDNIETRRHLDTLTERYEVMKADRNAKASLKP
jgi:eukaryotic-like serine/threonine-protein kinase